MGVGPHAREGHRCLSGARPVMSLILEDGTGLANADTFASLAAFEAYWDQRGFDYSSYDDDAIEAALRRASSYLSNSFSWAGYRVKGRAQALAWPRFDVVDSEGWGVPA